MSTQDVKIKALRDAYRALHALADAYDDGSELALAGLDIQTLASLLQVEAARMRQRAA